ncbi:hypothetical protein [Pseudonocardia sp. ICBG1142]|uniref:hypothetical protein n=1 Tax=Pseudonocardia sp. ICBG1142 TaxID=2846760 RepID=UPI001CF61C51|nr:hypothetical protein [Pseudonocardia sp. ICBG1142]
MSDPTYRLLRELAGRVDDDLLATGRELVAVGEEGHALELLVAELVAGRAVLPHAVRSELVTEAAARRVQPDADACLPPAADVAAGPHRFDGDGPPGAAEAVAAALAGVPVPESGWTLAWRTTPAGAAPGPLPQPVLLARTGPHDAPEVLTYQAQAALARAGLVVSVEVGDDSPDPDYHRTAREVARPLPAAAPLPAAPLSTAPPTAAPLSAAPPLPAAASSAPSHDTPSHDAPSRDAPSREAPSRDDVSAEGALPTGDRPAPPTSAHSSDRAPDDRPSVRAGLVSAAVPPDPRPDRDAPSIDPDPEPDALGGLGSDAAPAFDAVPARDRADGSPVRPAVAAEVPDPGRSPAPIPDDRPAPRTDGPSTQVPEPADRPGHVDPVSTGRTTTSPGTSGPGDRPVRSSDAAASRTGADPGTPATGSATSPSDATGPGPDTGTSAGTAHGPETATADPAVHGPEAGTADPTGTTVRPATRGPRAGTPDSADPGSAGSRGPAARPVAVPAEGEDTAHPAPRPSPPIRALREATGGDWFDSPPEAGSPNPTPASGVAEVSDVPRHRFVAESVGPGNGHSPDQNGAHPATADRGPVAGPPERPVAPDTSPSGRPPRPSDGPPTPPVNRARPGPPGSPTAPETPTTPESPTTPVPPVAATDPSPVGRRSTRRDLDVPPRGAAGRAPAGNGPAPVVAHLPVGAPAAPGPDEASWLADWASGAWVGEIGPPEEPARTDRTDLSDVDRTVPGTPHVVPAVNGTAPASSETPADADHAVPAPHARAGLPDTGRAPDEAGSDPVDEAPTPPPGVPIRRAPAPPAPADRDRRPRHLLLTDDEPDEPKEPDEPDEPVADTTEPADVVTPAPATDQPAPRPPEEPAAGLATGPAEAPAPRPRPRPRPSGGLADRLTPTEQDLLQRLHEELAARENGGEPTPRNGTARTDRG